MHFIKMAGYLSRSCFQLVMEQFKSHSKLSRGIHSSIILFSFKLKLKHLYMFFVTLQVCDLRLSKVCIYFLLLFGF